MKMYLLYLLFKKKINIKFNTNNNTHYPRNDV